MKTNEKSRWFYSDSKSETNAIVLIAPGLNLLPSKMDSLARFLTKKNCDVFRIALGSDPLNWAGQFEDCYEEANNQADILNRPLYFLGFSLGGLLGIHYILRHPHHQFKKLVLMAPATHTRFYTLIPALLARIFKKGSLPSWNLENYRQKSKTSLEEYKQIHDLQREIKSFLHKNSVEVSTLLITNPKDELVASNRLTKFAATNPQWKALSITNKGSQLPKKYHHLMIDKEVLGDLEWENLLKSLTNHFGL